MAIDDGLLGTRGRDLNLSGLVRQYAPKGSDVSALNATDLQLIEDKLNRRPRSG